MHASFMKSCTFIFIFWCPLERNYCINIYPLLVFIFCLYKKYFHSSQLRQSYIFFSTLNQGQRRPTFLHQSALSSIRLKMGTRGGHRWLDLLLKENYKQIKFIDFQTNWSVQIDKTSKLIHKTSSLQSCRKKIS